MLSYLQRTPLSVMQELQSKYKARRKELKLSQKELSSRADVSLGSLKRFEHTGQISLESLLKLSVVLECLEDFGGLCVERENIAGSIEDLLNE